ncbi:MAG: helix-turn-helix domain-containing protein [Firmicutes bacterium]|nr:helix-turn-helix domain-containing protein [Bacillota bacterium]
MKINMEKFEKFNRCGYGVSPSLLHKDQNLTIEAKGIYCYFMCFLMTVNNEPCLQLPKVEEIVKDLNISENRYYKHLKLLKENEYII